MASADPQVYRIDTTESGKFSVVYRLWAGYFGRSASGPFKTYAAARKWANANIDDEGELLRD